MGWWRMNRSARYYVVEVAVNVENELVVVVKMSRQRVDGISPGSCSDRPDGSFFSPLPFGHRHSSRNPPSSPFSNQTPNLPLSSVNRRRFALRDI